MARHRQGRGAGGAIVNVTSIHGEIPDTGRAAEDAAEGGLRNLARMVALGWAPRGIGVTMLALPA